MIACSFFLAEEFAATLLRRSLALALSEFTSKSLPTKARASDSSKSLSGSMGNMPTVNDSPLLASAKVGAPNAKTSAVDAAALRILRRLNAKLGVFGAAKLGISVDSKLNSKTRSSEACKRHRPLKKSCSGSTNSNDKLRRCA